MPEILTNCPFSRRSRGSPNWKRVTGRSSKARFSAPANGVVDCVEGAQVRLLKNGATVAEAATDNYGDFKFDRLGENSGEYIVEISAAGQAKKAVTAKLGASINLGEIRL